MAVVLNEAELQRVRMLYGEAITEFGVHWIDATDRGLIERLGGALDESEHTLVWPDGRSYGV